MKIGRDEARRIAALAHLEFDDAALDRMAGEMTKILEYIEMLQWSEGLQSIDGGGTDVATPLREDRVQPSVDRDAIARNAPDWEDGFFVVPPVIE